MVQQETLSKRPPITTIVRGQVPDLEVAIPVEIIAQLSPPQDPSATKQTEEHEKTEPLVLSEVAKTHHHPYPRTALATALAAQRCGLPITTVRDTPEGCILETAPHPNFINVMAGIHIHVIEQGKNTRVHAVILGEKLETRSSLGSLLTRLFPAIEEYAEWLGE